MFSFNKPTIQAPLTNLEIKNNQKKFILILLTLMFITLTPLILISSGAISGSLRIDAYLIGALGLSGLLNLLITSFNYQVSMKVLNNTNKDFFNDFLEWTETYPEVKNYIHEVNKIRDIYESDWLVINSWVHWHTQGNIDKTSDLIKLKAL